MRVDAAEAAIWLRLPVGKRFWTLLRNFCDGVVFLGRRNATTLVSSYFSHRIFSHPTKRDESALTKGFGPSLPLTN
jgi:hypothetical protein